MDFRYCKHIAITLLLFSVLKSLAGDSKFFEDLISGYKKEVRPRSEGGQPVKVVMEMYINHFGSIDAVNMQFEVDMNLRQRWRDPRLAFSGNDSIDLGYERVSQIWVPDVYFRNAKAAQGHMVTVPNQLLRIAPNGDVIFSQRLAVVLICNMELAFYPLDDQICSIEMESFGFTLKDMLFEWRNGTDPVIFNKNMELPEFNKNISKTFHNCSVDYSLGSRMFPCVSVRFLMKREYGFYLIQTFVPSILIVMLSWVSFWLDPHATPARISLGLLTVLTMTTQISGIVAQLPKVSYVKAIDIWMAICLMFVFAALMEFAVVNVLVRSEELKVERMKRNEKEKLDNHRSDSEICASQVSIGPDKKSQRKSYMTVEIRSRVGFPAAFALFNLFFWLCTLRVID